MSDKKVKPIIIPKHEYLGGNVGKKVNIAGVEIEVRPDHEAAKAEYFVCATKEDCEKLIKKLGFDPYPEGSKGGYFCRFCNVELQIAPSGQKIEAMGAKPCCVECAMKSIEDPSCGN